MRKRLLKPIHVLAILLLSGVSCMTISQPLITQTPPISPAAITPVQPSPTSSPTAMPAATTLGPATTTLGPATMTPELPTSIPPNISVTSPSGSIKFQNPQKYQVAYEVTVYNNDYGLDKLLVYQPLPVNWDGQGDVNIEDISPKPTREDLENVHGNGMVYWDVLNPPQSGDSLKFMIQFSFTGHEIITEIDPEKIEPYNQENPLYRLYLQPERYIESTNPKIIKISNQVAGDETNPYKIARKFYDYIIDTADYRLLGRGLMGAKSLANTGFGECGDYAALFVALSRAKGIPARPVVGYWAVSGTDQTHVWAEFYIEGLGWIPVDPTIGQDNQRDYYFGNMDNQRVIVNKGFNIKLVPPGPDNYTAPFLQVPLWWYWGSSGDENSVSIERTSWIVKVLP